MNALPLLCALLAAWSPEPSTVELGGERWESLQPKPDESAPGPWVQRRDVVLEIDPDGITVRGSWEIRASKPGLFVEQLLGPNAHVDKATLNGDRAWIWTTPNGIVLAGEIDRRARLEVEAFLPAVGGGDDFPLLGASVGRVRLEGSQTLRVRNADGSAVVFVDDAFVTGSSALMLEEAVPADPNESLLVVADTGVGITVGENALEGRAKVQWQLRRGSTKTVAVNVHGVGADLELKGPNVAEWTRNGNRIDVRLKEEAKGRVDATLHWSTTLQGQAEQHVALPSVSAADVFRQRTSLQLATDGDLDVAPSLRSWSPIAARALPEYGRGLIRGTPTAAFSQKPGASTEDDALDLYRFEAVPGPPVVVEVAEVQLAVSDEGRVLTKARYEVLNERAPFLDITPPPGAKLVGVWVAGKEVRARKPGDVFRVPLKRSLETVEGLLTFPVEIAFLSETAPLERTVRRDVDIPKVAAPISVSRVIVRLPNRFKSLMEEGDNGMVNVFSRGNEIAYGLADQDAIARADTAYGAAIDAWNRNEFDDAKTKLQELEALGAQSKNQAGLQSNVDMLEFENIPVGASQSRDFTQVVESSATAQADGASFTPDGAKLRAKKGSYTSTRARRIKARARARSTDRRARQRSLKKKAKQQRASGSFKAAERTYQQAIEETRELRRLEDSPASDYAFEADELEGELQGMQKEAATREQLESGSVDQAEHSPFNRLELDPPPAPAPPPPVIAPLLMPRGGVRIRFQHVLLAPDATPSIKIEARRRRSSDDPLVGRK